MNNEIKEILSKDNIHIIECEENWCNAYGYEKSQLKEDLLDYITNLQEENEKLQKRNKEIYDGFIATQEELSDYATRNEKAIEYIIENNEDFKTEIYDCNTGDYLGTVLSIQAKSLLNILNGADE